jgi:RNA polymerase sigma-70 factor (ECF subfamily)
MLLVDLLSRAPMLSAPLDPTDLAPLRALLFQRLRASGWTPSGALRGRSFSSADSDSALLATLITGEAEAFDSLFDRHAPQLNGYARRELQPEDAKDAVQDTFIVLFEKARIILEHEPVNVRGFLFSTLRNKILHILATRAREAAPEAAGEDEPSLNDDGLTALLRREDAERLARLLDRVCNPLQQAIIMLHLEDRDGPDIARELGITEVNVRVLRHRAFKRLREALDEEAS